MGSFRAYPARAAATIIAALLVPAEQGAIRFARLLAKTVDAGFSLLASAATSTASIVATVEFRTVFRYALRFARLVAREPALGYCRIHAKSVPVDQAAEGIEFTDTLHNACILATRCVVGFAAVAHETGSAVLRARETIFVRGTLAVPAAARPAILRTGLARLPFPLLAHPVAAALVRLLALPFQRTDKAGRAVTAGTSTPVVAALHTLAVRLAIALQAAFGHGLIHAYVVPLVVAAELVEIADAFHYFRVVASRETMSDATVASARTILRTVVAILAQVGLTNAVSALLRRIRLALAARSTDRPIRACSATAAAAVVAALLVLAFRHTHAHPLEVAHVSRRTFSTGTTAAVVSTLLVLALRLAKTVSEVVTDEPAGTLAAGIHATIIPALLAFALGGAVQARTPLIFAGPLHRLTRTVRVAPFAALLHYAPGQIPVLLLGFR